MRSWHVTSCALPRLGTDTPRVTGPAPAGVGHPGKWGGEDPVIDLLDEFPAHTHTLHTL